VLVCNFRDAIFGHFSRYDTLRKCLLVFMFITSPSLIVLLHFLLMFYVRCRWRKEQRMNGGLHVYTLNRQRTCHLRVRFMF